MSDLKSYLHGLHGGLYGVHVADVRFPYCQQDLPDVIHLPQTIDVVIDKLIDEVKELKRKLFWTKIIWGSITIFNLSLLVYLIYNTFIR